MTQNVPPRPEVVKYVPSRILREGFNSSQIPELIERGELTPQFLRNAHLEHPDAAGEETCTRGQMVRYLNAQGTWIVEVFQYLRSNGTLGASGRPDPKRMRVWTAVWIAER